MTRRAYRNGVALVFQGMSCAISQAASLQRSAQSLLDRRDHALALSVAVLSLEEVGKAILIDGLLFAKSKDEKATAFDKGYRRHTEKLRAVEVFPQFVEKQALADPRSEQSPSEYAKQISSALHKFRQTRTTLGPMLAGGDSLESLDDLKQKGFYTALKAGATFVLPSQAIAPELAAAVVELGSACVKSLDFLFLNGTGAFEEFVSQIRGEMTETDHQALESHFEEIYRKSSSEEKPSTPH